MRAGVYTGGGQGLPEANPVPLAHIEDVAGTFTFTQDHMDLNSYKLQLTPSYKLHPEMKKHFSLQYVGGGSGPFVNLRKYN